MAAVSRQGDPDPFDAPGSSFSGSSGSDDDFSWDEIDHASAPSSQRQQSTSTVGESFHPEQDDWERGQAGQDDWGSAPVILPPGKPPFPWLAASLGLSVLGLVLAFVLRQSWPGLVLAWLLAGPLAILALSQYLVKDGLQRARPMYTGADWARHLPTLMGVFALACVVVVAVVAAGKVARAW